MIWLERFFANRQRTRVKRLRLCMSRQFHVHDPEVVKSQRNAGMIGTKLNLPYCQRARKKRLCFCISPQFHVQHPEVVECSRNVGVIRSERVLQNCQCAGAEPLGRAVFAARPKIDSAPPRQVGRR